MIQHTSWQGHREKGSGAADGSTGIDGLVLDALFAGNGKER